MAISRRISPPPSNCGANAASTNLILNCPTRQRHQLDPSLQQDCGRVRRHRIPCGGESSEQDENGPSTAAQRAVDLAEIPAGNEKGMCVRFLDPRADRKRAAQMGNVDSDKSYVRYVYIFQMINGYVHIPNKVVSIEKITFGRFGNYRKNHFVYHSNDKIKFK